MYALYGDRTATRPTGYAVAYRQLHRIDVVGGLVPYAAENSLIELASPLTDETFFISARGSLERRPGMPKDLKAGRRRAERRLVAAADTLSEQDLPALRTVLQGQPGTGVPYGTGAHQQAA